MKRFVAAMAVLCCGCFSAADAQACNLFGGCGLFGCGHSACYAPPVQTFYAPAPCCAAPAPCCAAPCCAPQACCSPVAWAPSPCASGCCGAQPTVSFFAPSYAVPVQPVSTFYAPAPVAAPSCNCGYRGW